jgi:hypothetical protein
VILFDEDLLVGYDDRSSPASSSDPDSAQVIRSVIEAVKHTHPRESDIARVRARLAAGGWPLARPRPSDWP